MCKWRMSCFLPVNRHLHDGAILLLRPEFFSLFLSYLNLIAPVRFKYQNSSNLHKKAKPSEYPGDSSKMTPSCKWTIPGDDYFYVNFSCIEFFFYNPHPPPFHVSNSPSLRSESVLLNKEYPIFSQ